MKKNRISVKRGLSLIEIAAAVLVFSAAVIPLYHAMSYGAKEDIHIDKIAVADKILTSFRDEIKNMDFKTVAGLYGSARVYKGTEDMTPNTFKEFLKEKEKYKDFEFEAETTKQDSPIESISFKAKVTWTSATNKGERKLAFVKVNTLTP
ncbi:MAG TPA: hypothetical protein PLK28_09360 [Candidatus Rifleibacterium sp.]|nr:hypothetical protein [Candidatus Rifleibacterium sp.]HOI90711.1 hypothetical protein [Candidatus Rifleibacterium sp.]